MIEKIKTLIAQGEGLKVEFKEAQGGFPKSVYETICAFSNTQGGEILLGVADNGEIKGVPESSISQYKKDFSNTINNPDKINPQLYLSMDEVKIDGRVVLYILVPKSSAVHRCSGKIIVRSHEGDIDITNNQTQVARLYSEKDTSYSENDIYPYITMADLREDLIDKCRKMAIQRIADHPWKDMSNEELLRSAGLYKIDRCNNKEGYTLACVLLFGKDDVILDILPHHRTDLIVRVQDKERYDDRDTVKTNLIESYDRIMAFVNKHLPSPFYLEGDIRIDIRSILFREIAVNMLIHREFTYRYYARLIIEADKITIENANKPFIHGNINPDTNIPHPKNPILANFFKEIGLADELGSGVRKITKYAKSYAGHEPVLEDGEVFKVDWKIDFFRQFAPNTPKDTPQATPQVTPQARNAVDGTIEEKILTFCQVPKKALDIMEFTGYKDRKYFKESILNILIKKGSLELMYPDKPNHPHQKYITVKRSHNG